MAHHGWVPVEDPDKLTPDGLKSPFGRLFPAENIAYDSLGISLLAGPDGPLETPSPTGDQRKQSNPAGFTFLGQFIDHDLTEFRVIGEGNQIIPSNPTIGTRQKLLEDLFEPESQLPTTTNGRSGKLDLDSVYGLLGATQPDLFSPAGLFLWDKSGGQPDLMRGPQFRNNRLIADPRNDENKLVVQIHLLFERLHNKLHQAKVAAAANPALSGPYSTDFKATKKTVQQIYRQIVLFDYLPRIVSSDQIAQVLGKSATGQALFQKCNERNDAILKRLGLSDETIADAVAIPVEFSHAVFRLGHSQLRPGYVLNFLNNQPISLPLFNTAALSPEKKAGPGAVSLSHTDLRGNEPLSALDDSKPPNVIDLHVDWKFFFLVGTAGDQPELDDQGQPVLDDQGHPKFVAFPQHGEPLDGHLPRPTFRLPPPAIGEPPQSLAERNIRRGVDFGLPSGQAAANRLVEAGYEGLSSLARNDLFPPDIFGQFVDTLAREPRLAWDTPLWYYMLKDAEKIVGQPQLGPVGGLIVAETIIGSYLESEIEVIDPARRALEIRSKASSLVATFANGYDAQVDELDPTHRLYHDKVLDRAEDIFSMSQLVRYVS
ncbi:peroxidase family protein [Xanthobacter aminoxidans]|uniref:peroxidase family protein n=1 Tax=Xanthobacter aminoxidans TaxID=186280 RepID=UPI003727C13D